MHQDFGFLDPVFTEISDRRTAGKRIEYMVEIVCTNAAFGNKHLQTAGYFGAAAVDILYFHGFMLLRLRKRVVRVVHKGFIRNMKHRHFRDLIRNAIVIKVIFTFATVKRRRRQCQKRAYALLYIGNIIAICAIKTVVYGERGTAYFK